MAGVKEEAAKLILQAIESGLADSDAGDVKTVDEVREEFGLTRDEVDHSEPIDARALRSLLKRSRRRPVSVDAMNVAILREHTRKS